MPVPVSVQLSDGTVMLVEVEGIDSALGPEGMPSFDDVKKVISGIGTDILDAIKKVAPSKASVEFGITLTVKEGTLTGMLVKGGGEAELRITLEWEKASAAGA